MKRIPASNELVAELNNQAKRLVARGMCADEAIRDVLQNQNAELVDSTDPHDTDGGYVELWRVAGRYVSVWFISPFGHASDVSDDTAYDAACIGFCNDIPPGWEFDESNRET